LIPRGITAAQADRYLRTARQLEFALRVDAGPALDGGAISLATDLRAASVDGVVQLDEQDIGRLVQCEIIATLLPGPAFFLGTGRFPPARRLIDAGAAVALASGYNPETSPSQNMQMMMSLACTSMRMTPAEAITAATINAAHAVRRASRLGSLESGKRADLLILSVPDYREIPYHFGVNLVDLVMTGGEILVRRSEVRWPAN